LELVNATIPLGVRAEIVCTNDDGPKTLDVPLGKRVEFKGAPVWFFRRWSPPFRPLREFAFSASLGRWLHRHIGDYDLVHVHALFSHAPSMAMRIARRRHVPYVNRPSGLLCRWSLQQSRVRKQAFLWLFDRANLNGSDAIEYTAEQERDEAADLSLSAPSFVMPYGLHLPDELPDARNELRQQLNVCQDERVIIFMSRLHPKKGVHFLIEALQRLAANKFTLVIAGSGVAEYETELKVLAASGPLRNRTRFVGFAAGRFKQLLLQGSDLFVLPSHSESFAIALMEAFAAGIPVITTPGVPLALLVEKFQLGWLCQPDADALAASLAVALPTLVPGQVASEHRHRARLVAGKFTWDRVARQMQQVYKALLQRQPLPSFELRNVMLKT
jgi:glycosyltransferase involved in cell wall biosynthesis